MPCARLNTLVVVLGLLTGLAGCTGTQTFTTAARAGETVALTVGYRHSLQRQNMTVTITDAAEAKTVYAPNDARVRGVVNLYPDPVSKVVVGYATGQNMSVGAVNLGDMMSGSQGPSVGGTAGDPDWWMTTVLLDLPKPMASGAASIAIADSAGAVIKPARVEVLPGTATANLFNIYGTDAGYTFDVLSTYPKALQAMERATSARVTFQTPKDGNGNDIMPHAIQAEFSRTPGVGKPWIVNPRGDLKNVTWSDNGSNLKVMVTPTAGTTLVNALDLKFYIAGGLTGLTLTSLKAYDINGNLMSGIQANVQ